MTVLALVSLLLLNDPFVAAASSEVSYTVTLSRESLRGFVDDIGLLARNMPGVVSVEPLGDNRYLYRTEKSIPLAGTLETEFLIRKTVEADSITVYESIDRDDPNYMLCRVTIVPRGPEETDIRLHLSLRMVRDDAGDVHWLAPLLGEEFISDQMQKDLDEMIVEFIERSNEELYSRIRPETVNR